MLDQLVERALTFSARRRFVALLLLLGLSALAASQVPKIVIDTSYDSLMRAKDPGRVTYDRVVERFGSDNTTIVTLKADDVFTPARLQALERLSVALQDLEGVTRVDSLFTVRNIKAVGNDLASGPLFDEPPADAAAAAAARRDALANPLYVGNLVSKDGRVTAVNVTVRSDIADPGFNRRFRDQVEALLQPLRGEFADVTQIGPPRLNDDIERSMFSDLGVLTPLSTLILVASLFLLLRNGLGAVFPLASAGVSILWTFGFMGAAGLPLTILTAIVPSLVIVIGSTEDTHMVSEYLHGIGAHRRDRGRAIAFMARHVGMAIFLTGGTTALGFFSNAWTDITLIRQFAFTSGFAMAANTAATVLTIPLLLATFGPLEARAEAGGRLALPFARLAERLLALSERHGKAVLAGSVLFVVFMGWLSLGVSVSNDPLSYFRASAPIVRDSGALHRDLSGMQIFYVALEAGRDGAFGDPEYLGRVARIQQLLDRSGHFDKTVSLADHVALVHREMHAGQSDYFRVPTEPNLIPQYLLFFQRQDLEPYATANLRHANIIVRHDISASDRFNAVIAALEPEIARIAGPELRVHITGRSLLVNAAAESLLTSQVKTLLALVVVLVVLMSFVFTSLKAGFIFLVPNLIPIVTNFGLMKLLGVPLNPGTATVAAVALGIAVDDTIHLMLRYNAERKRDPSHHAAMQRTLGAEVVPVVTTSVALALGFAVLVFSDFAIVLQFGAFAALTMLVAMLCDLIVTPSLLGQARLVTLWDMIALKLGPAVLEKSPLFAGLRPWEIKKAILLCGTRQCATGETVLARGAKGSAAFLVLTGEVRVHLGSARRAGREVARFGPGQVFGEIGFLADVPRTATVVATRPSELMYLERDSLAKALRFHPFIAARLYRNLAAVLGDRLAAMNRHAVQRGKAN